MNWDDKEQVLKAVQNNFNNYLYASNRLKKDDDVIVATLKSIPTSKIPFQTNFIKSMNIQNPYLILEGFKEYSLAITLVNQKLRSDEAFMLYAIKLNPYFFVYADESLKNDRNFLINAINVNPEIRITYDIIPLELRQDPEIVKDENRQVTKVRLRELPINLFFFNISKKDVLAFRKDLKETIQLIKSSRLPNFNAVLNGNIYIGSQEDLILNFGGGVYVNENTSAYYTEKAGIFYILPTRGSLVSTLIHEFSHKYHYTLIKEGYGNDKVKRFAQFAKFRECTFPKIGDPLSNLREDWWLVKMASDEYYLKKIDRKKNYIYKNIAGDEKIISSDKMSQLINCPSEYSMKNHREFVAELCTLITLNKVTPAMQSLADDFITLLEEERI